MSKKRPANRRQDRYSDPWNSHQSAHESRPRSNRKYLKELDRELQRFITRVAGLEAKLTREGSNERADFVLESEELHREALLLRAEIREALASGRADLDHVVDTIDDSWEQLLETLEELRGGLQPERPEKGRLPVPPVEEEVVSDKPEVDRDFEMKDYDEEEEDYDDYDEDDFDYPSGTGPNRIHRPRTGPKR